MTKERIKPRVAIAEEAAEWFVEWREGVLPRADKARFTDWLAESPVHVEEYLAIAKLYGELTHIDPAKVDDVNALVDDTIVALHGDIAPEPAPAADLSTRRRWASWGLAATVLIAIASSFVYFLDTEEAPATYTTGLGEQRSILMDDGSMVSLNTASGIEVAYSNEQRRIKLTHGEALFDVQEDKRRPFWVETDSALIRVTGTQFNVYEKNGQTSVTVIEGTVEVAPRASPAAHSLGDSGQLQQTSSGGVATLDVGDQAIVTSGSVAIEETRLENLDSVTAWTDRRLVFSETPLAEIVAEFNRYNHQRLILDDATVATLEVSGVFSTHDPDSLVLFLERIADVHVEHSPDGSEIHVRAAGSP